MTDARRYLLSIGLVLLVVIASIPFWEQHLFAVTALGVPLCIAIYEGVWWGHVDKPRDEYHDDGRMEP